MDFSKRRDKRSPWQNFLELDKLKPGFDLINDILDFKPVLPNSIEKQKKAIQYTVGGGLKTAIRIVPVSYFVGNQFSRISEEIGGYDIETAASLDEAERILDKNV